MPDLTFAAFSPEGELRRHPLPLAGPGSSCILRLRGLAGASAIHLAVSEGQKVKARLEIPLDDDEPVQVQAELDGQGGGLYFWSPDRPCLTLAPDGPDPAPPIPPPAEGEDLDLVVILDGTLRQVVHDAVLNRAVAKLMLADQEAWRPHALKLQELIASLARAHRSFRATVFAFGDQKPPYATATDLLPDYLLLPESAEERTLQPSNPDEVLERILAIPATSGGDYVDALADALDACANLNWRRQARRIVLVNGDSPGHSVLQPLAKGCDACARAHDLDVEAMRLHQLRAEIITLFHDPPQGKGLFDGALKQKILQQTKAQYRRLASLEDLAFEASTFDAQRAAETVLGRRVPIGRGPMHGELLEILSSPGTPDVTGTPVEAAGV